MLSFRKFSRSASAVSGVMTVYGFVLAERLNLVMQEEILSVYTTDSSLCESESASSAEGIDRAHYTYGIHFACLPFLL